MRWFVLIGSFLSLVFVSFLIFLWTWRAELVARCFEKTVPNTSAHVGSVAAHSLHFIDISDVVLVQKGQQESLQIEQILLQVHVIDLLSWWLPIRSPLIIEKATVSFSHLAPVYATAPKNVDILIQEVEVLLPDGKKHLFGEEKGSIGSILSDIIHAIDSEKSHSD